MEEPPREPLRDPAATPPEDPESTPEATEVAIPRELRDQAAALRAGGGLSGSRDPDPLIGGTVDHYRVLGHLGGGGMGVVYRAEDSRLSRTVALKFLPPALTRDPVAKSRFLQEARAASALDHPNLCTVFDIGETGDGRLYLAMPAYDGETVKAKIARGPLPVGDAVEIALQVAQGLAKAHRQGIVHRDIKPANLIVTRDGLVKILDFGLAKLAGAAGLTRAGFCVGTPAYISPEQARGEVDHRTDLWSLGVVLYEMLTGELPFRAEIDLQVLRAVLEAEPPPICGRRPGVPPALERIVAGLLKKNVADRYPAAENVIADLRRLGAGPPGGRAVPAGVPEAGHRRRVLRAAAAAVLGAAAVLLLLRLRGEPGPVQVASVDRLTREPGRESQPSMSGGFLVYSKIDGGDSDIFWKLIQGDAPRNLTEDSPFDDSDPALSPDGTRIAFRSERDGGGIFVMGATGESVRRLADFGHSPAWSPDGTRLAVATEGAADPALRPFPSDLWVLTLAGARKLVAGGDAVQPSWSPSGSRIVYWGIDAGDGQRSLWTVRPDGSRAETLLSDFHLNWNPVWSSDGHVYFLSDRGGSRNLWRVRVDERSGRALGEPQPLGAPSESVSGLALDGGRIVYTTSDTPANVERVGFDPHRGEVEGGLRPVTEGSWWIRSAEISPDGEWVAFDTSSPREEIHVVRIDGSDRRQLTEDLHKDRIPRWSPDGSSLLFYSNRSGKYEAWRIRADGSGLEALTRFETPVYSPLWSPDGRRLIVSQEFQGAAEVDLTPPVERRQARPLPLRGSMGLFAAEAWSPDGRWLAGYLKSPGIRLYSLDTGTLQQLTQRGSSAAFLHRSRRLLYLDEGRLFLLDIATRASRELLSPPRSSSFQAVSVSADDRSLVLVRRLEEGDAWLMTLKAGE